MDGIPLFLNMARITTIKKIGPINVNIKTHDKKKFELLNIVNCSKWYKIIICLSIQSKPE